MLFSNPRAWTERAVGTWGRFILISVLLAGIFAQALLVAADSGLRSGLMAGMMPTTFQLMFLYALRRMYRQATGKEQVGRPVE